jgi:organic radical activating enzyme
VYRSEIVQAWGKILKGEPPSLSIEITKECPLKCPGCYAYDDGHLGGGPTLRDLNDRRGQALVDGVLEVVDRIKPLHLSIVGGDPLVRYRELELMIPPLLARGVHVQIVTSAFELWVPPGRSWSTCTSPCPSTVCNPNTMPGAHRQPTSAFSETLRDNESRSIARSPVK